MVISFYEFELLDINICSRVIAEVKNIRQTMLKLIFKINILQGNLMRGFVNANN